MTPSRVIAACERIFDAEARLLLEKVNADSVGAPPRQNVHALDNGLDKRPPSLKREPVPVLDGHRQRVGEVA